MIMAFVDITASEARNRLQNNEVSLGEKITREIRRRAETNHDSVFIDVNDADKSELERVIEDLELKNFDVKVSYVTDDNPKELIIHWNKPDG